MADEKRNVLAAITAVVVLLTALVGFFSTLQPGHVVTPSPTPQPDIVHPQPPTPTPGPGDHVEVPDLTGTWTLTGALQDGTPFSGQTDLQQNGRFVFTVNGVTIATGDWNTDAGRRQLRLQGSHALYGKLTDFKCTLEGDPSPNVFQGSCTDYLGTGTWRLAH